jgi:hypothetical protein
MNTIGLNSNIADLALIVAKLKKAEATAELWASGEDNITDKYAYKYGLMVGQVNAVVDALETRLMLIEKALEIQKPAVTEEKPRGVDFLEASGYYESVVNDVKAAADYDDAIATLTEWFNDLDRGYELGSGYLELRVHAVLAYGFFDRNGWL